MQIAPNGSYVPPNVKIFYVGDANAAWLMPHCRHAQLKVGTTSVLWSRGSSRSISRTPCQMAETVLDHHLQLQGAGLISNDLSSLTSLSPSITWPPLSNFCFLCSGESNGETDIGAVAIDQAFDEADVEARAPTTNLPGVRKSISTA